MLLIISFRSLVKCADGKYLFSIISVRESRIRTERGSRLQETGLYCPHQTTFLLAEVSVSAVTYILSRRNFSISVHLLCVNTYGAPLLGRW